jgi:hypothetical protein
MVWVLADCCRAAPDLEKGPVRRVSSEDLRRGVEVGGNLIVCTGSRGERPSFEHERLGHGLFTQVWLDLLQGKAPEHHYRPSTAWGKGITLHSLVEYLPEGMRALNSKLAVGQEAYVSADWIGAFPGSRPIFRVAPSRR